MHTYYDLYSKCIFDIFHEVKPDLTTMLRTILHFVLVYWLIYTTSLVTKSIYQATFPASPHNRGEVIDYGAEFLQEIFQELRLYYPRFDYLVTTVNLVLLQVLLTVTMRYKMRTAMYTGYFIAVAIFSSAIVAGKLLFWVAWTMNRLGKWVTERNGDSLLDSLMDYLMEFYENLRFIWWSIRKIWNGGQIEPWTESHTRTRKQDTRFAAEEGQRAPRSDHTRRPSEGQGPRRGRSAPPRSADIDPDEDLRRFARKMEKDMQDLYGDADTPRGRRGREEFVDGFRRKMGMEPIFQMQEAGDRITELPSDDEMGSDQSMEMVKRRKSMRPAGSTGTYKSNKSRPLKPMPTVTSTPRKVIYNDGVERMELGKDDEYIDSVWNNEQIVVPTYGKPTKLGVCAEEIVVKRGGETLRYPRHDGQIKPETTGEVELETD